MGTDSLLCSFISPNTFFLPESSLGTFILHCVTAASFSSPGPAPRLQPPCSVSALSIFPACCMHVQHGDLLHHCKVLQRPWAVVACLMCCVPPLASLLSTYGSTPASFAVCANVEQGDRHTLILSLAQSWRADFWNVLFENCPFWGLSVLSPAYHEASSIVSSTAGFSVSFPLVLF